MMKYLLILIIFINSNSFSQTQNTKSSFKTKKKIYLFGEAHFIKEKYDEIKAFTFEKIDDLNKGEKISFFFELPYSINYAFKQMKDFGDTTVFYEWFNHLYQSKNKTPSYFWTDYRDFILELIHYADNKGIELELIGIDTELEFRRTAFILSQFENKIDTTIESLVNLDYIRNDSLTRSVLLNQIEELSKISQNEIEFDILKTLKNSLTIDCTICLDRDQFMYSCFKQNFDSTSCLNFVSLGLNHIVSKHDFSKASPLFRKKYKFDTIGYQSFYELLDKEFKDQTLRVGILALNNKLKYFNMSKPSDYKTIMNSLERDYIEKQLLNKDVYRIKVSENKVLNNLSEQLDYLIIYRVSHYRWE